MNSQQDHAAFQVGKYLVSPMTGSTDNGAFSAAVSIRSGSGRCTHDRVYRFLPQFATRESASRYASREGMAIAVARL